MTEVMQTNFGGIWYSLGQSQECVGNSVCGQGALPDGTLRTSARTQASFASWDWLSGLTIEMVVSLPTQQLCRCLIDSDLSYLVALWVLASELTITKMGNGLSDRQPPFAQGRRHPIGVRRSHL